LHNILCSFESDEWLNFFFVITVIHALFETWTWHVLTQNNKFQENPWLPLLNCLCGWSAPSLFFSGVGKKRTCLYSAQGSFNSSRNEQKFEIRFILWITDFYTDSASMRHPMWNISNIHRRYDGLEISKLIWKTS
jgi:hypothetical protein